MFRKGDRVRYLPPQSTIPEFGAVSSVTENYVFVKYDTTITKMLTGEEPYTAKATHPEDLTKVFRDD